MAKSRAFQRGLVFILLAITSACNLSRSPNLLASNEDVEISSTASSGEELPTPIPNSTEAFWRPEVGTTSQLEFNDFSPENLVDVVVYDIDLFDNDAQVVSRLHEQGYKVICYISAGSWEDWRSDRDLFPPEVIGNDYEGWPGEKWLDIRKIDLLAPILTARMDLCKQRGFDGIDPDNVDGYTNDTGFPLDANDQLQFNIWLANEAHARGLSIGLKNDPDQAKELEPYFDWALTEDCFAEDWCEQLLPFIQAGKPVLAAEYTDMDVDLEEVCPFAKSMQFSLILKNRNLDEYIETCP